MVCIQSYQNVYMRLDDQLIAARSCVKLTTYERNDYDHSLAMIRAHHQQYPLIPGKYRDQAHWRIITNARWIPQWCPQSPLWPDACQIAAPQPLNNFVLELSH